MVAASVWSLLIPAMEMGSGKWSVFPAAVGFLLGMAMLALAVTIHNLPEGMAVGMVFAGAENGATHISLASAVAVSLGIAI